MMCLYLAVRMKPEMAIMTRLHVKLMSNEPYVFLKSFNMVVGCVKNQPGMVGFPQLGLVKVNRCPQSEF